MVNGEIRLPAAAELELLRDIERDAGTLFSTVGLDDVTQHEPETVEGLAAYLDDERIWVIVAGDEPVGYAVVDLIDGAAHLEQVSVRRDHGRRGLGSALVEHVCEWARAQRLRAVTLTTFSDVPWNQPFYERLGFRVIGDDEMGPELYALRAAEATHGLDPARRVCMRRDLDP
jgi:ribosomal protein S18 acetylase RimI-like enzyme